MVCDSMRSNCRFQCLFKFNIQIKSTQRGTRAVRIIRVIETGFVYYNGNCYLHAVSSIIHVYIVFEYWYIIYVHV